MARYIDADKLIADGWHLERHAPCGRILSVMSIADVPTADVEEVKHGKWEDYADSFYARIGRMDLRCSVCNKRASAFVGGTEDWWDNYMPDYCPNCGAKMDSQL